MSEKIHAKIGEVTFLPYSHKR